MKKIILLCSTVLLAGCHIYKPYSRPETGVEMERLYGQDVAADDTASIATLPWTELFTDARLQSLIREGLENNTDLGIARLRVEEAEATLFSSRLAYLPSVSLAPQGGLSSYDGAKTSKTYTLAASAEWEIDLFGKLTNAKRGARAALEGSRAYRQAVQTQLIATIANSYYNLHLHARPAQLEAAAAQKRGKDRAEEEGEDGDGIVQRLGRVAAEEVDHHQGDVRRLPVAEHVAAQRVGVGLQVAGE